jgi:Fe-S-cluster containining protein
VNRIKQIRTHLANKSSKGVPLHFAFPDGVFHYVCRECTEICCKGHGFGGSLDREFRSLFVVYPQLERLTLSRVGDTMVLATTPNGCVMLDSDNLCRIERELGKSSKPNVCRLFPFNVFARVGQTVTVSPHFLCPLRLQLPARPGEVEGTHATLETVIRETEILSPEYLKHQMPRLELHSSRDPRSVIGEEEKFRDLCTRALGVGTFPEALREASAEPEGLDDFIDRAARLMRMEPPVRSRSRDNLDDLMLAMAPSYRLRMLALPREGVLRALAIAELTARAYQAAAQPPTPKGLHHLISNFSLSQTLLAWGDERVDLSKGVPKRDLTLLDPELTFAAYIFVHEASQLGVLGALEKAVPPAMSVSDRTALFNRFGALVDRAQSKSIKRRRSSTETLGNA